MFLLTIEEMINDMCMVVNISAGVTNYLRPISDWLYVNIIHKTPFTY